MSKLCKCNVCCTTYFILYIPYSLSVSCKLKITAHILFLCYQILYTYALSRYISLYHLYTPCFHISCIYFIFLHTIYALFFPILSKFRLSYCIQHQLYNSCSLHCHPLLPFCGMQALRLFPLH